MKALTVQQPWAAAMFWTPDPKDIENRSQLFTHRGSLAIHAGQRYSVDGARDPVITRHPAWTPDVPLPFGVVIGVVDLIDGHKATDDCCANNPWAQPWARVHLSLASPRLLTQPIDCFGKLGLWDLPAAVFREIRRQLQGSVADHRPGMDVVRRV